MTANSSYWVINVVGHPSVVLEFRVYGLWTELALFTLLHSLLSSPDSLE
jgi:hypothetical protein